MPEYAKNQPAGFKNAVERVAVVGVCIASNRTYTQQKKKKKAQAEGTSDP